MKKIKKLKEIWRDYTGNPAGYEEQPNYDIDDLAKKLNELISWQHEVCERIEKQRCCERIAGEARAGKSAKALAMVFNEIKKLRNEDRTKGCQRCGGHGIVLNSDWSYSNCPMCGDGEEIIRNGKPVIKDKPKGKLRMPFDVKTGDTIYITYEGTGATISKDKPKEVKRWKPEKWDECWYLTVGTVWQGVWKDGEYDNELLSKGLCFRTREQAEVARERIKQLLKEYHNEISE